MAKFGQTYSSETVFQIGTVGPSPVTGRFIYRYYEPGEGEDETLLWVDRYYSADEAAVRQFYIKGSPRYVELAFDRTMTDMVQGQNMVLAEAVGELLESYDDAGEIWRIGEDVFSENDIQKNGYVGIDFNPTLQTETLLSKVVSPAQSVFDAFMNTASNTAGSDLSLTDTALIDSSTTVTELEPSTGQQIQKASGRMPDLSMPSMLNDDFIYDVMKASELNTCLGFEENIRKDIGSYKTLQTTARATNSVNTIDLNGRDILSNIEPFVTLQGGTDYDLSSKGSGQVNQVIANGDFAVVGHAVFKYRIESDGSETFMDGYIVTDLEFRDYYVSYGRSYVYDVRTIVAYCLDSEDTVEDKIYLFYSTENIRLTIPCLETVSPLPPKALRFSYYRDVLKIEWMTAHQITEGSDGIGTLTRMPVKDIKGYQVFCRTSLDEPYQIKKYYHFHDGDYPIYAQESIPAVLKEKTNGEVLTHMMTIESNKGYYFAMCSIDAHGNSSAYSEQVYVYHDKISGKLTQRLVSDPGAPKAYPNMNFKSNIFKDSIQSSYYNNLEIVYHPDIVDSVTVSSGSSPIYAIQLIDISSMTDKVINLVVKANGST